LPCIFDLFTQAERSIDRSQGGLGIGLTVAKSLVEMHVGRLSARSAGLGQGSEFTIQLPVLDRMELPRLNHSRAMTSQSRRILVVDDNVAAARMLCLLFSKWGGHDIRMAQDGPSALHLAQEFQPEVVLLDIGLPRMDGYEVARELRKRPESAQTLLVALTGYGSEEDRRRSRKAGFDEHLIKPLSSEDLKQLFEHPKLEQFSKS
jgi:CheY-like chemotaxis protein